MTTTSVSSSAAAAASSRQTASSLDNDGNDDNDKERNKNNKPAGSELPPKKRKPSADSSSSSSAEGSHAFPLKKRKAVAAAEEACRMDAATNVTTTTTSGKLQQQQQQDETPSHAASPPTPQQQQDVQEITKESAEKGSSASVLEHLPPMDGDGGNVRSGVNPERKLSSAGSSDDAAAARRKASVDSSEDQAFGLMALGSVASSTLSEEQQTAASRGSNPAQNNNNNTTTATTSALDHLDALGDDHASLGSSSKLSLTRFGSMAVRREEQEEGGSRGGGSSSGGTLASSNQRLLMEALMMTTTNTGDRRRDRLESWGAMSDLSIADPDAAAAAFTASALQETGILGDVTAAAQSCGESSCAASAAAAEEELELANGGGDEDAAASRKIPSRISLHKNKRPGRKQSATTDHDLSSLDGPMVGPDIQAFVQAAMQTVGDQLAELAGAAELAASGSVGSFGSDVLRREAGLDSDASSYASPLIGAISERELAMLTRQKQQDTTTRSRSSSISASNNKPISVDYDAVAAAVDAAQAAAGSLDLSVIGQTEASSAKSSKNTKPPPKKAPADPPPIPPSTLSKEDMEAIRARARAAAGYVPPSEGGPIPAPRPPIKKRPKMHHCPDSITSKGSPAPWTGQTTPRGISAAASAKTPKISNSCNVKDGPYPSFVPSHSSATTTKTSSTSQKWDEMFECLLQFINDRKAQALKDASEQEKKEWVWDGNVPTNYKTKDGKALGRWINNQRSAKTKGTLKEDREEKLVSTGLRWCVLVTNPWDDMMNELRIYVREQTKDGKAWDGNVPTNYQVKREGNKDSTKHGGDEDKNLGRWINRQRSLYQSGKLRKDRQQQLEKIGLKWSVLATTSWDSMFESLRQYVKERKESHPQNVWDGNVPAKYETNDKPPKALGRWINRQRSAFAKRRLKKEFVDKLDAIGLKWSVHERRQSPHVVTNSSPDDDGDDDDEDDRNGKEQQIVSV